MIGFALSGIRGGRRLLLLALGAGSIVLGIPGAGWEGSTAVAQSMPLPCSIILRLFFNWRTILLLSSKFSGTAEMAMPTSCSKFIGTEVSSSRSSSSSINWASPLHLPSSQSALFGL